VVLTRHILHTCSGIGLALTFAGCSGRVAESNAGLIASYKERSLTREMLAHSLPKGLTLTDSMRIAKAYVQQWLVEQAVMDDALKQHGDLAEEVEYKVQDYKAKLIMNGYENRIVEESLDRNVSTKEILAFYEANRDQFISPEALYSYLYIVSGNSDHSVAAEWMKSGNPDDLPKLREWARHHARDSKIDSSYVGETEIKYLSKNYFGSLQKLEPGKFIRWSGVIRGERLFYLFKMIDVVRAGQPLGIAICRDKIVDLILNERKVALIEKNEEMIFKNARAKHYIREY
jgi:hypothetical protein